MTILKSEADLIQYCLRALGHPVITINVSESQLSDRISDALSLFSQFHEEGSSRTYVSHKVTGSHLQITTNVASNFKAKDIVTCNTSGATFEVYDTPELNKIRTKKFNNFTPIAGETITVTSGVNIGQTAVIATNGIFIGDTQNEYITLPDEIISIIRLLPWNVSNRNGQNYMFDATYQIMLSDIFNYRNADMTYYTMIQQHLALLDFTLNAKQTIDFSRIVGRLNIPSGSWESIAIDQYLVMECYSSIVVMNNGVAAYSKIYDNFWVKKYSTALIKKQFAINLGKFANVILPGGITLNSERMMTEATEEINKLEAELTEKYAAPLQFFVG